jgi:hypothetical protein
VLQKRQCARFEKDQHPDDTQQHRNRHNPESGHDGAGARVATAEEGEHRDRHLAQNEHGRDDPAAGKSAHSEQRDVHREVVASGGERHQHGGGEPASHRTSGHLRVAQPRTQTEETPDADGQWHQTQEPHGPGGELNEYCRRGGGERHHGQKPDDLTQRDAVGALGLRPGDEGRSHQGVVDIGAEEGDGGDPGVGCQAGAQEEGSGMAGP